MYVRMNIFEVEISLGVLIIFWVTKIRVIFTSYYLIFTSIGSQRRLPRIFLISFFFTTKVTFGKKPTFTTLKKILTLLFLLEILPI